MFIQASHQATVRQFFAAFTGTIIGISDGMGYGWPSPMIPYLESGNYHITISSFEGEWLETITLIGAACGLPGTIYSAEKLGRKLALQLAGVIALVSWLTVIFAPNVKWLLLARFLIGMAGNMCFVAAPMYIAEIANHKIRGLLSSLIYMMMLVGITLMYAIGAYAPYYAAPVVGIVLISIQLVLFSFFPESAYYLAQKNKLEKAKLSLEFFRPDVNTDKELADIIGAIERQKRERESAKMRDLMLDPCNRKSLTIVLVLNAAQHCSAISVFYMNLHAILADAGSVYIDSKLAAILFSVTMLLSAIAACALVDNLGRRSLLLISGIATGLCLLVIAVYFHLKNLGVDLASISWIPVVFVMVYAVTFKFGMGMVPIVISSEIFPQKIKATGMTLGDAIYVCSAIVSLNIYYYLFNAYGMHAPFYTFSACTFLALLYTYFFVPETKGKTLDEIQQMLEGKKSEKFKAVI